MILGRADRPREWALLSGPYGSVVVDPEVPVPAPVGRRLQTRLEPARALSQDALGNLELVRSHGSVREASPPATAAPLWGAADVGTAPAPPRPAKPGRSRRAHDDAEHGGSARSRPPRRTQGSGAVRQFLELHGRPDRCEPRDRRGGPGGRWRRRHHGHHAQRRGGLRDGRVARAGRRSDSRGSGSAPDASPASESVLAADNGSSLSVPQPRPRDLPGRPEV